MGALGAMLVTLGFLVTIGLGACVVFILGAFAVKAVDRIMEDDST